MLFAKLLVKQNVKRNHRQHQVHQKIAENNLSKVKYNRITQKREKGESKC